MISKWILSLPWDKIQDTSLEYRVPFDLLGAIIQTESGGNPYASRYEPNYRYLFYPDAFARNLVITRLTEEIHQKTSWGYMQIMGGVARELGFKDHLPRLSEPSINLKFGAKKLRDLLNKYDSERLVIASYNAGSPVYKKDSGDTLINERYVDKVYSYLRDIRKLKK